MDRDEKLAEMTRTYALKREERPKSVSVMKFHHTHLLLFMGRFRQLVGRFETPSSSLLSHDIFLVVQAATRVALEDWKQQQTGNPEKLHFFDPYFNAYKTLAEAAQPLDQAADLCLDALQRIET